MTGQPSFTFRESEETPRCRECGEDLVFLEVRDGTFNERDIYGCTTCAKEYVDRWTF